MVTRYGFFPVSRVNSVASRAICSLKCSAAFFPSRILIFLTFYLIKFQNSHEGRLRYFHIAHLPHALFSFLLFFQQLSFPRNVAAVTLGRYVFPERRDRFPCDDFGADRCLDGNFKLLPGQELL